MQGKYLKTVFSLCFLTGVLVLGNSGNVMAQEYADSVGKTVVTEDMTEAFPEEPESVTEIEEVEKIEDTEVVEETEKIKETDDIPDILEAGIIAQGTQDGYTWKIDDAGKLTIRDDGSGNSDLKGILYGSTSGPDWTRASYTITSLDVDVRKTSAPNFIFAYFPDLQEAKVKIDHVSEEPRVFLDCKNLKKVSLTGFSGTKALSWMFAGSLKKIQSVDLSGMDFSEVTDARGLFSGLQSLKEVNLSNWDTSEVVSFAAMFSGCSELETLDLSSLDTRSAQSMVSMFEGCNNLKNLQLGNWDTSKVKSMNNMFNHCNNLESLDLSSFDFSQVTDTREMFANCSKLKTVEFGNPNSDNLQYAFRMFDWCSALEELDLSGFDVQKMVDMGEMFRFCSKLHKLDMHGWKFGSSTTWRGMFSGVSVTEQFDFSGWNFMDKSSLDSLFEGCLAMKADLSGWDVSHIESMEGMFAYSKCEEFDLNSWGWDVGSLKTVAGMFVSCCNLKKVDFSQWNCEALTSTANLFGECEVLENISIPLQRLSQVQDASSMFLNCKMLTELNLSQWNTQNLIKANGMFYGCEKLNKLNIANWNTGKITNMDSMFRSCASLKAIDVADWNTESLVNMNNIFDGCLALEYIDLRKWNCEKVKYVYGIRWFDNDSHLQEIGLPKMIRKDIPLPNDSTWYRKDTDAQVNAIPKDCGVALVLSTKQGIFTDVDKSSWKYTFAKYVYDKKIMTGKGQNVFGDIMFAPDDNLTRAELAQMLYSMEGKPAVTYTATFSDVPNGQWFTKAVLWANSKGIATGVGGGKFNPTGKITREQVATMLKQYALMKGYDTSESVALTDYPDAETVSSWAKSNISWAVAKGVISGKALQDGSKILDPKGNATRAECAAMIKSFQENVAGY